jgi:hypothetical protein
MRNDRMVMNSKLKRRQGKVNGAMKLVGGGAKDPMISSVSIKILTENFPHIKQGDYTATSDGYQQKLADYTTLQQDGTLRTEDR